MGKTLFYFLNVCVYFSFSQNTWSWTGTGADNAANVIVETSNSQMLVGGKFVQLNGLTSSPGLPVIARGTKSGLGVWQWSKLGTTNGDILDATVYNSEIYIAGRFTVINGSTNAYGIAKYTSFFSPLGGSGIICSLNQSNCGVYALREFNGELYAGGTFTNISGSTFLNIAKWNGTSWSSLGSGISGGSSSGGVRKMIVYNNELYVMGIFTNAGGVSATNIAKWDGSSWSAVASIQGTVQQIACAEVFNDELYIGGNFSGINNIPVNRLAKFDGTSWSDAGQGLQNCGYVTSMAVLRNELYGAGFFDFPESPTGFQHVGKWNGNNWESFGSVGKNFGTGSVSSLSNANDALFVSGVFGSIDNGFFNNIAVFAPASHTTALAETAAESTIKVMPNPFNENATIQMESRFTDSEIHLFDCLGNQVNYMKTSGEKLVLNRNNLSAGIYTLRLTSGDNVIYKKIIVSDN